MAADNNNSGFLFQGNYISDNDDVGVVYETSPNAAIRNNAIIRNACIADPKNDGPPTAGIHVSESGADRRVGTIPQRLGDPWQPARGPLGGRRPLGEC